MSREEGIRTLRGAGYELVVYWHYGSMEGPEDRRDMNIDIEIRTPQGRFSATVFTLQNVATLLARWRTTGERPNTYFQVADAVIVDRPITEELLRTVAEEAVSTGAVEHLQRLDDTDPDGGSA
jgi:hypothetical protein